MRASELCVRVVATVERDESVVVAARRMVELRVGDLIVIANGYDGAPRPIGIVTDRDLVVQVLARPERDAATTKVGDVMQPELVTANEDDDMEVVVEKMREHAIRRIVIVDDAGGLQGVLALDDVIGWMRDQMQAATELLERQDGG